MELSTPGKVGRAFIHAVFVIAGLINLLLGLLICYFALAGDGQGGAGLIGLVFVAYGVYLLWPSSGRKWLIIFF